MRQESSRLFLKWKTTIAAKGQVWCYLPKGDGPSNPCWLSSSHRQAVQQAPQQLCCQSHQRSPAWEIPPKRGSEVSSILRSLKCGESQGLLIVLALVESSTITQTMPSLAQTNRPRGWEGRGKTGAGTVKWPWNWGQGRSWKWEGVLLQWWGIEHTGCQPLGNQACVVLLLRHQLTSLSWSQSSSCFSG